MSPPTHHIAFDPDIGADVARLAACRPDLALDRGAAVLAPGRVQ
jgi:hypothetical protein